MFSHLFDDHFLTQLPTYDDLKLKTKKDELITNQEKRLDNCSKDSLLVSKELKNKDEEIKLLKKDLTKEKFKKWVSAGFNALQAAAIVFILIKL